GAVLEVQPTDGTATLELDALRIAQFQAFAKVVLLAKLDQFVEEAADLAAVARDFRGAFLLFVEFLQHGHRDEDVVFLETEQRGRIMQQDVGIESVDALASGHAEVSSLVGGKRWRTKAMEGGQSA